MKTLNKLFILFFLSLFLVPNIQSQIIFEDGFEDGWGNWFPDNGVWEVGEPDSSPVPFEGNNVAGTVLDGNYPTNANTRLISPNISLPVVGVDSVLKLKFWHWFQFGFDAYGNVQISVNGGNWEVISNNFDDLSGTWTEYFIDLSEYAGQNIRLGFYFQSDIFSTDLGWYIDDINIFLEPPLGDSLESFENGQQDWFASNGVWEIGEPVNWPFPFEGSNVAGTILDGNYPTEANSRLISHNISLPSIEADSILKLKFWHYFQFGFDAYGNVQISVNGGNWEVISNNFDDLSGTWTEYFIDLSEYAGQNIRLGFYFQSDIFSTDLGWYIDDINIFLEPPLGDSLESFENGQQDWFADNGVWEIGNSQGNPDAFEGTQYAGTILNGNYPTEANSRLVSPKTLFSNVIDSQLKFWHWYQIGFDAQGVVQLSVNGNNWQTIGGPFNDSSGGWSPFIIPLSGLAEPTDTIQIGFNFTSDIFSTNLGWYIDNIEFADFSTSQPEICDNNLDDDGDNLIDCEDPDCTPTLGGVTSSNPFQPDFDNGQIIIQANGTNIEYSINGGTNFQINNTFDNLIEGSYNIRVQRIGTDCFVDFPDNPVVLENTILPEICNNGMDDDGDDLIDCEDPDCEVPFITLVSKIHPTEPNWNNGQIAIDAIGGNLEFSVTGGANWQTSNIFTGLVEGNYIVWVRNVDSECVTIYEENPVTLNDIVPEICDNGIDDDGDELIDCADPDCGMPFIVSVNKVDPTAPTWENGQIEIEAMGANLEYSITGGNFYQSGDVFLNLTEGNYLVRVRNTVTGCLDIYNENPVELVNITGPEICNNGIDDDLDNFTDCEDPDCGLPLINQIDFVQPTAPNFNNGQIMIDASGDNLIYSINNGMSFQSDNVFENLSENNYFIQVRNSNTGCTADYFSNPFILENNFCTDFEIVWGAMPNLVCPQTMISPIVLNSNSFFNYELLVNNLKTNEIIGGNGGAISFSEIEINQTSNLSIRVTLQDDETCIFDLNPVYVIDLAELAISAETIDETDTNADGRIEICIENGVSPYSIFYEPNRGDVENLPNPCEGNFEIQNLRAGFYNISVIDASGCEGDIAVEVSNPNNSRVGFPEKPLLTPNGDGLNDELIYDGLFAVPDDNELIIYDRYGGIILEEKPYRNNWDGTFNGEPVPGGTYFYTLKVEGSESKVFSGFITIIR